MNENNDQTIKSHNLVLLIITLACIGAIAECISQKWELWVIPLIVVGIAACWTIHVSRYREVRYRESFYLFFAMLVAFFHGVHETSYYDLIVVSGLTMSIAAILKRKEFLTFFMVEFYFIMAMHTIWGRINGLVVFDSLTFSRIAFHCVACAIIYKVLSELLKEFQNIKEELEHRQLDEDTNRMGMEDFLVNISHELRTPVNVINGMSTLILKREMREDVKSIRDAGLRLSRQIEDIQNYSEIERGDVLLEVDKYNMTSLINDIVASYNIINIRKDIEFIIDLDPTVPNVLKGDSKKLHKIISHLIDNAFKFTKTGVVYLKITGTRRDYGINLIIEVTDTGIGMTDRDRDRITKGSYQANKKRNRSTGGIGLGLSIVYGFVRVMNGFVGIESVRKKGTTVRVCVAQEIVDASPCLSINKKEFMSVAFYVNPQRFTHPDITEFYRTMAQNLAAGLRVNLYNFSSRRDLKKFVETGNITHIFIGIEEYREDRAYFEKIAGKDIIVTVFSEEMYPENTVYSPVIFINGPIFGYQITRILNGESGISNKLNEQSGDRLLFEGVRALIVDDEPMNLVVATGLFKDYHMIIDTADSAKEALVKYDRNEYDVVFMDHMMPEMDGVEAMKKMKFIADQKGRVLRIIALTANAISGAREMFLREGFDGFISKPINISDFERVMTRVLTDGKSDRDGGAAS